MNRLKILIAITTILLAGLGVAAQAKPKPTPSPAGISGIKSSAAYSEVVLRRAELMADLEGLLVDYQEEYPPIRSLRSELGFLQKEIDRLLGVRTADVGKLSAALGKLMIRKAQSLNEVAKLQRDYTEDHPDVKSAKRKVEVFESAIKEILD